MTSNFDIESYDYDLPEKNIAQFPPEKRDASRLLVLDGITGSITDRMFGDFPEMLSAGDLLVVNDTKVFPARLMGRKKTGGRVEMLILGYPEHGGESVGTNFPPGWETARVTALLKCSKRPKPGDRIIFGPGFEAMVQELFADGKVRAELHYSGALGDLLDNYGMMPLPPYISRKEGEMPQDRDRYQTVYATRTGAVAAPTAGLHFTDDLLDEIGRRGVDRVSITLHVGYGTFAPVRVDDIREHRIHSEYIDISDEAARKINETRDKGKKIWVVGTTTARALEFAADENGRVSAAGGWCDLYIYPGYRFKVVKNLITNFHLPKSSLLYLVSALAGRERIMQAYRHAVDNNYRFYSYGDAMAVITDSLEWMES